MHAIHVYKKIFGTELERRSFKLFSAWNGIVESFNLVWNWNGTVKRAFGTELILELLSEVWKCN